MSFGIGYYEDGVWVDHAAGDPVADSLSDDVHAWYGCCSPGSETNEPMTAGITVLRHVSAEPWGAEGAPAGDAVLAN